MALIIGTNPPNEADKAKDLIFIVFFEIGG
jgi:hypothetical protein